MSRVGVALLVTVLGVSAYAATATTKSKKSAKSAKTAKTAHVASRAKHKHTHSSRKKSHTKAGKQVALTNVTRRSADQHMPNGWAWPPNDAMKSAETACEQSLDGIGLTWERATPEGRIADPVYVPAMEIGGIKYTRSYGKGPTRMDCELVQTLAQIGPDLTALGVREVQFGSVYRNTNVRVHGATLPFLSRHALGIAMDIKAFVDDKGRVANVELDYLKGDPLLHGIEDKINATHKFRTVLTPGNDPLSHYDHFHIEAAVDFTAFR